MTDTKATRPPTQRELTDAEKNYAVLAITQPDGIYVSDRTLGSVLGELPVGQPGSSVERVFPDRSKLVLSRNSSDWGVRVGEA